MSTGEMMQEKDLKEIESLILKMEGLEKEINKKQEQKIFIEEVIAEKQRLCEQAKEEHERRIEKLSNQARRVRGRRGHSADGRAGYAVSEGLVEEPAAHPLEDVDVALLDEALKPEERKRLIGDNLTSLSAEEAEERLALIAEALQEKLKVIRQLSMNMAELEVRRGQSGDVSQDAFQALKSELSAVINLDEC